MNDADYIKSMACVMLVLTNILTMLVWYKFGGANWLRNKRKRPPVVVQKRDELLDRIISLLLFKQHEWEIIDGDLTNTRRDFIVYRRSEIHVRLLDCLYSQEYDDQRADFYKAIQLHYDKRIAAEESALRAKVFAE